VRDVLYVGDLLRAFEVVRQARSVTEGQVYNLGGGPDNTVSLLELIAEIERLTGRRIDYVHDRRRIGDQLVYITDFSKLRRHTGWEPQVDVRTTLATMAEWWRSHRALFEAELATVAAPGAALQEIPGAAA
jgi:CDP-paratose 2-epimerase